MKKIPKIPKLDSYGLVWDVETSYMITEEKKWGFWDEHPIERKVIAYPKILTVAWHWIGDNKRNGKPKVYSLGQDDLKGYKKGVNDDMELLKFIWGLLDHAQYEVAHNGDSFDVKVARYRFIKEKFPPYTPVIQVDTKKMYKRNAKFPSNSLKDISKEMGGEQKADAGGISTWDGCLAGEKKSWKKMKEYNEYDIYSLLDIYLPIRAWDKNAVPLNSLSGNFDACPKCGKNEGFTKNFKYKHAKTGAMYQYLRCRACYASVQQRIPEDSYKKVSYI